MGSPLSKSNPIAQRSEDVGPFAPIPFAPRCEMSFFDYVRDLFSRLTASSGISSENVAVFPGSITDLPRAQMRTPDADVAYAADGVDASLLGAAAPPPPPSPHLRRQPTPDEAARYAEVARQLNEVARQIEADYSDDLDLLVGQVVGFAAAFGTMAVAAYILFGNRR